MQSTEKAQTQMQSQPVPVVWSKKTSAAPPPRSVADGSTAAHAMQQFVYFNG